MRYLAVVFIGVFLGGVGSGFGLFVSAASAMACLILAVWLGQKLAAIK